MVKSSLTPEAVVARLNELLQVDPVAVRSLLFNRVPCNARLAAEPEVQVCGPAPHFASTLGLLNGLFGAYGAEGGKWGGFGCIAADVEPDWTINKFYVLEPAPKAGE